MFEKNIQRGANFLDRTVGIDWPLRINWAALNMEANHTTIVGQLDAGLFEFCATHDVDPFDLIPLGLACGMLADDATPTDAGQLTKEWKRWAIENLPARRAQAQDTLKYARV